MSEIPPGFDLLKLLDRHRFHYVDDKTCHFCRLDQFRKTNTPESMWAKSLMRVVRPPLPVAIMAFSIAALTLALALSLTA